MIDLLRWAPESLVTWIIETDNRPGMVKLRENRTCAHEVAAKLIGEKRQELKDGAPQRDVLALLGSSRLIFPKLDMWYNFRLSSQGEFLLETGLAAPRRRNCRTSSVNDFCSFPFK